MSQVKGLRGLLIALVIIVLSAGVVAAAGPDGHGLATAAEKAGKTVPVAAQDEETTDEETTDETTDQETTQTTEQQTEAATHASTGGDHCATDPRTLTAEALALLNHGAIVCWAAHQPTPAEFANHGAWVRSWAQQNHGHTKPPK